MIYSGQLGPGDRLPTGVELAARLGISVVTLRVALKSLESTGYIVTSRGAHGGSSVSDAEGLTRCWTEWMSRTPTSSTTSSNCARLSRPASPGSQRNGGP